MSFHQCILHFHLHTLFLNTLTKNVSKRASYKHDQKEEDVSYENAPFLVISFLFLPFLKNNYLAGFSLLLKVKNLSINHHHKFDTKINGGNQAM